MAETGDQFGDQLELSAMKDDPGAESGSTPCIVCRSNSGSRRISPGPPIFLGRWWRVEHAWPCALPAWLVIVLERHAEALHELTASEAAELGRLQLAVAKALRAQFDCVKEYSMCLGEGPGFGHLHFHMVPRAATLGMELRGARVFEYLNGPEEEVLPADTVTALCEQLRDAVGEVMSDAGT